MNWIARGAAAAVVTAGAAAARRVLSARARGHWPRPGREAQQRWHTVTVNRPQEEVAPQGRLPEPLAPMADSIEMQIRRAPGDRGTELAARLRDGRSMAADGAVARLRTRDRRYALRSALREAKQLLETGEVLSPHRPPTAKSTVTNKPVQFMTRHAREEGRL